MKKVLVKNFCVDSGRVKGIVAQSALHELLGQSASTMEKRRVPKSIGIQPASAIQRFSFAEQIRPGYLAETVRIKNRQSRRFATA